MLSGFGRGGGILTALLHISGLDVTDFVAKLDSQSRAAPFYPLLGGVRTLYFIAGAPLSLVTVDLVTDGFVIIIGIHMAPLGLIIEGLVTECVFLQNEQIPW